MSKITPRDNCKGYERVFMADQIWWAISASREAILHVKRWK